MVRIFNFWLDAREAAKRRGQLRKQHINTYQSVSLDPVLTASKPHSPFQSLFFAHLLPPLLLSNTTMHAFALIALLVAGSASAVPDLCV